MPRNSAGIYTLPRAAFVPGTVILSSAVNADFLDIGNTVTTTIATTGVTPVTGVVRASTGSRQAPSFAFATYTSTGFYLAGTNVLGIVNTSVSVGTINASATAVWSYLHTFNASVIFSSQVYFDQIYATVSLSGDLIVTGGLVVGFDSVPTPDQITLADQYFNLNFDTTAPALNLDNLDYINYNRTNNVFNLISNSVNFYNQDVNKLILPGILITQEILAPASASADSARLYAKDVSGSTLMYYKDDQGVETPMGSPGQWEMIGNVDISTLGSIDTVTFALSKIYSRLVLTAIGIQRDTNGVDYWSCDVSDDAGVSYKAVSYVLIGDAGGGGGIAIQTTNSTGVNLGVISTSYRSGVTVNNSAFRCEWSCCDKASTIKQYNSDQKGVNSTTGGITGSRAAGQLQAACGVINAIRFKQNGDILIAGIVTLYGLRA